MSTLMQFNLAPHSLLFEAGGDYPAKRKVETFQVSDRNASGDLLTEALGITKRRRILTFNLMPKTDYDNLINFFLNVCIGSKYGFEFIDEYGDAFQNVKILEPEIDFDETSLYVYSGSITLEW